MDKPVPAWIYAYVREKVILYVGQSARPRCRDNEQRKSRLLAPHIFDAQFVILRKCDEHNASRLERQIIRACKRNGQAILNRVVPKKDYNINRRESPCGTPVLVGRKRYPSVAQAARALDISEQTLKNYYRLGYEELGKITILR